MKIRLIKKKSIVSVLPGGEKNLTREAAKKVYLPKIMEEYIHIIHHIIHHSFIVLFSPSRGLHEKCFDYMLIIVNYMFWLNFKWSFCLLFVGIFFCNKNNNEYKYPVYFPYSWYHSRRFTAWVENVYFD